MRDLRFFSVCVLSRFDDNDFILNMQYFLSILFFLFSTVIAADSISVNRHDLQKAQQQARSLQEDIKNKKRQLAPYCDEDGNFKQGVPSNAADLKKEVASLQNKLDIVTGLIQTAKDHLDASRK